MELNELLSDKEKLEKSMTDLLNSFLSGIWGSFLK